MEKEPINSPIVALAQWAQWQWNEVLNHSDSVFPYWLMDEIQMRLNTSKPCYETYLSVYWSPVLTCLRYEIEALLLAYSWT